jgi:type IV pilus assembly protein PilQ
MKTERRILFFTLSFLIGLLVLSGCATVSSKTPAGISSSTQETQETTEEQSDGAYIKDVVFEKMKGKEQVSILLSDIPDFDISRKSGNALVIKLRGVSIPKGMKKEYSGDGLRNLKKLSLYQKTTEGENEAYVRVLLKRMVPYRYRKDGTKVVVDFDVSTLSYAATPTAEYSTKGFPPPALKTAKITPRETALPTEKGGQYTGEKMTLDFQNANIKSVFRLISEVSGFSIVAGPDVKAEVTAHMKNIPWDQALDTILEVNGLGKKQSGKVITVLPLEKLKKAEEEQQKKDVAQGKLRQISIEAKIVEVNTTFARELGIRWGAGYKAGSFAMGMGSASSGDVQLIPGTPGIGFTGSSTAVNFPGTVAAPVLGMVLGTSKMILDAQLSALETTGDGKIISSPKVTTLDGVKATIKQGEEIPYKVVDDDGSASTSFKDAVLKLEVTPTVTPGGRISIDVKANNDYADWSRGLTEPPIKTSSVESTVVVKDGDTIVIGGIYYTVESKSKEGVPWLSDIPIIGWLFKTKGIDNTKRELLIFITPRIIEEEK